MKRGVVVVHTGEGKGKSTAAFGVALRAAGHGQKVGIVQFVKGTWKTGEQAAIQRFPEISHVVSGEGFAWEGQDRDKDVAAARRGWQAAVGMIEAARAVPPAYDLVVLDELCIALGYHQLPLDEVLAVLRDKPAELSVVITGRDAPPELIELADTVTEMRPLKHAFEASIKPRRGVDF
jgi:cob(I)alamin adenosyltransferase